MIDIEKFKNDIENNNNITNYLNEIINLSIISQENQKSLGLLNINEILCDVIVQIPYTEEPDTVDLVLTALLRLCRRTIDKSTSYYENCDKIINYFGIKKILHAISNHIYEPNRCIGTGCYLIMVLASDSPDRQLAIAKDGAPIALAAILYKYSNDSYISEMASRATRNLSANDEVANMLASEGVCEALVKVLKESIDYNNVIEQTLWAIVNMSCDNNISTIFGSADVFTSLYNIFEKYSHDSNIIDGATNCIRNLTSQSYYNISIVSKRSDEIDLSSCLITCLESYIADYDLVETILYSLSNIAIDVKLATFLLSSNLIIVLNQILQQCLYDLFDFNQLDRNMSQSYNVIESAMWLVRNLSELSDSKLVIDSLLNRSIIDLIIQIIQILVSTFLIDANTLAVMNITIISTRKIYKHMTTYPDTEKPFEITKHIDIILPILSAFLEKFYNDMIFDSKYYIIIENTYILIYEILSYINIESRINVQLLVSISKLYSSISAEFRQVVINILLKYEYLNVETIEKFKESGGIESTNDNIVLLDVTNVSLDDFNTLIN